MARTISISPEVEAVLRNNLTITGNRVVINTQLERSLYAQVNKVFDALGGKWSRGQGAHVFKTDVADILADALDNGSVVNAKQTYQQYYTPADLAAWVASAANPQPHDIMLEPSAGQGGLLQPCLGIVGSATAVEIDPANTALLRALDAKGTRLDVIEGDFLKVPLPLRPNLIIANPPFTRNSDIAHALRAWDWLLPGGRMIVIMSPHGFFAGERTCTDFRAWLDQNRATVHDIPAGAFKDAGTNVATHLLVVAKAPLSLRAAA